MEVDLRQAQPTPEIRHARKAAVENYPLRATRLDLSVLSDKEQKEIQSLLSDPIKTYVGIGRDAYLTAANWAMVKREGGFEIWQAQIHSAAALSLKVRFSDFDLGLGMSVKVYGLGGGVGVPVGEYTGRGLGDGGKFWSLSALGDTVVVEYWLPAELETYPDDFPFKVERISHRFRDEEGKLSGVNARRFVPRQSTCGSPIPVCSANNQVAQGVASYEVTDDNGNAVQCSGTMLNNERGDGALYFLTAFHCIDDVVRSSEDKRTFINARFRLRYDNCGSEYIEGKDARFIAGSESSVADWALLHIDGELLGGRYRLLGWDARPREKFAGYTIHHGSGQPQKRSSFDSVGLAYVVGEETYRDGSSSTFFSPCSDVGCSHFGLRFNQSISSGASGASILVDGRQEVVGVFTNSNDEACAGAASRFSKMYEDGRVQGTLAYGADYFLDRGEARNFDDSARPDYNPVSPVIEGDGEIVVGVVYGSNSWSLTLRAEARNPSLLRWRLLANSGPSVTGSRVRFLEDKGAEARLVYGVPGGIQEEDQFSVQASSAGGSDMVTVHVRLIEETLLLPPECKGKGLATAPGDGGSGNPYRLSTLCQLQDIHSQLDAHYRLIADIDASASRDWNGGSGFLPIAKGVGLFQIFELVGRELVLRNTYDRTLSKYAFSGSFDGDGFSVDGLVVNREEEDLVGLFSVTNGAVFKNVRFLNSEIKGREGVGALAGAMIRSMVSGFHFRGSVDGSSGVGGLSGINYSGSIENGLVSGLVQGAEEVAGGLTGGNLRGTVSDVSAYELTVSGKNIVGGLVGYNGDGAISRSHADAVVTGSGLVVGGLLGWGEEGAVRESFAVGAVSGFDAVGGLVGACYGSDVYNSYATASVSGAEGVGGLVGLSAPESEVANSYATGAVAGSAKAGSLVGNNQGEVRNSYASGVVRSVGNGEYVGGLLGDIRVGSSSGSFMRTLAQLKCPPSPGQFCQGASSYVGWSEQEWDFGDANTLPTIRSQSALVIAGGDEETFVAAYGAESAEFTLRANASGSGFLVWGLADSGSSVAGSSVRFPRVQGSEARVVYEVPGGIKEPDQFSVRVRSPGGSDVITVRVNVEPAIVEGDEKELSVAYGSNSVTLTLSAGAANPDSLRWQLLSGSGSSVPGSRVYFLEDRGAEARVVYDVSGGIRQEDQFSVQVSGRGGSDVITVNVVAAPAIVEGDEEALIVAYGSSSGMLDLSAGAVDADSLSWSGVTGQGSSVSGSRVYFLEDRGTEARVVYEVPGGIKEKDRFSVRVSDTYGSDEITIHVMPDRVPVISRVFGRAVDGGDELTVYISPQTLEVTLRAIAFDESPEKLKWTIADTSVNGATTARFLLGDAGENAILVSGAEKVRVLYRRGSTAVTSGSFVITVADTLGQTDSLRVRMVVDATTPVIANEGVMTTAEGKTLEVKIPYSSEQLILDLLTRLARAGLVGKPVSSTPTEMTQVSFLPADGEGVLKVRLPVQLDVDEAEFRIRVSNGSASEDIVIRVTREQFIPVRSKVLLGGATR